MSAKLRFGVLVVVAAAVAGILLVKVRPALPEAHALAPRVEVPAHASATVPARARPVPRLLDLGAGKCIPCKAMAPILAELRSTYTGRLQVDFIDVWQDPEAAEPYRIGIIPTQIFYAADGRELFRHEGFMSREDILARWKSLGVVLD